MTDDKEIDNKAREDLKNLYERFSKKDRIKKILNSFFVTFDEQIQNLTVAYQKKDFNNMDEAIHIIKGVSGNLELDLIYQLSKKLNEDIRLQKTNRDYLVDFVLLQKYCKVYKNIELEG